MKLQNILLGRVIRMLNIVSPPMHMSDAIKPLVERYGFVKVPQSLEEYDASKGITFSHGKFQYTMGENKRNIVIDSFQIYHNGVLVDTRGDTDDGDKFLDDVLEWGIKTYGSTISEQGIEKIYLSNLEVSLNKTLATHTPSFQELSGEISRHLTEYGLKHERFETTGLTLNFDRTTMPNSILTNFTIQRREGIPFSSGVYFSSAPLKTNDHIALLEKFDR